MTELDQEIMTFVNLLIHVAVTSHVSHSSSDTIFVQKTSSPHVFFKMPFLLELLCLSTLSSCTEHGDTVTPQVHPYCLNVIAPYCHIQQRKGKGL